MKPLGTNNLSAWGYVGLFILFNMPYIGTPAIILFAIFGNGAAKSFARAFLIIWLIGVILIAAVLILGIVNLGDLDFSIDDGVEAFRGIAGYLGI